jgi:hypothetical protein
VNVSVAAQFRWSPALLALVVPHETQMARSFEHAGHLGRGLDRQWMTGEAWPRRYESGHFAGPFDVPVGRFGEQGDDQVLQSDNANAKPHKLGICQLRDRRWRAVGR